MLIKKQLFKSVFITIIFFIPLISVEGKVSYRDQLSFGIGMVNSSFTQSQAILDEGDQASSGSVSVLSLDLSYDIFSTRKKSIYFRVTGSGMIGEVSKYYTLSGGNRFYFGADGSRGSFEEESIKIITIPIFRYYAGWGVGVFSMIYEPGTEIRSDLGVEFGVHGGALYSFGPNSSYKFELSVLKGTGIETSSIDVQIFFGVGYFMKPLF